MVPQNGAALLHPVTERGCRRGTRQVIPDDPAGDVVRGGEVSQVGGVVVPDEAVAVADAGVEPHPVREMGVQAAYELFCFRGRNVAAAVVNHPPLCKVRLLREGDKVAADGILAGGEVDADAGGLKRRTAGVALRRLIAERGEVGDVAARFHAVGHSLGHPEDCTGGEGIHIGLISCLHRGLPAQRRDRRVGHTVAEQYQIFHESTSLKIHTLLYQTKKCPSTKIKPFEKFFLGKTFVLPSRSVLDRIKEIVRCKNTLVFKYGIIIAHSGLFVKRTHGAIKCCAANKKGRIPDTGASFLVC